ncbi:MAG: hypothetical protein WC326_15255 [Candidatus Delongbacteria bacterium]
MSAEPYSQTPAALAMRRLRTQRREVRLGLQLSHEQLRIETSRYLYPTVRTEVRGSGKVWVRHAWEGRVQVCGHNHVITRSVSKYGARGAYLQCLNQVGEWLLLLYPADWVEAKLELLRDQVPET